MMEMMKSNNNSQLRFQHTLGDWLTARLVTAQRSMLHAAFERRKGKPTATGQEWNWCGLACVTETSAVRETRREFWGLFSITVVPIKHNNKGERQFFSALFSDSFTRRLIAAMGDGARKEETLTVCFHGCYWRAWSCQRGRDAAPPSGPHWPWSSSAVWPPP